MTLLVLGACQNAGHDRVLGIPATSQVSGLAYFDNNRSKGFDNGDVPMQGLKIYLVARGTFDTVATSISGATGSLRVSGVPVGRYDVMVDQASAGDTVVVVRVDTSQIDLSAGDTIAVSVGVSYPLVTVADVRAAPAGQKVFVAGVALTSANAFGDTTANILAATGPLRLVRLFSGLFSAGDSVLAKGTVSVRDGKPVLSDVTAFTTGIGTLSPPDSLATATAASASGGTLDAGLATAGGTLQDTVTVGRDLVVDVDDGSGVLRVLLDGDISFQLSPYLVPPARVTATGVLVPTGVAGTWYLKPRSNADFKVLINVSSTAQVRQRAVGTGVFTDGVALIRPNLFGDSTLHMVDTSGAIRVVKTLQANIFAGDSIRVAGTVAMRDGQVVISNPTMYRLGAGTLPNARLVTTAEAASAIGGVLDAAYVRVLGTAQILDTSTVAGDFRAVVEDGSGSVTIVLDGDVFVALNKALWAPAPSVAIDVRGVLVPEAGVWVLKPRSPGDVTQP